MGSGSQKLPRGVYPDIFAEQNHQWKRSEDRHSQPQRRLPDTEHPRLSGRSDSAACTCLYRKHLAGQRSVLQKQIRRSWHDRAVADQLDESAENERRHRHHQANAWRHRLHRIPTADGHQAAHGHSAKQDRSFRLGWRQRLAWPLWRVPSFRQNCRIPDVPDLRVWLFDPASEKPTPSPPSPGCCSIGTRTTPRPRCCAIWLDSRLDQGPGDGAEDGHILAWKTSSRVRKASALIQ